MAGFYGGLLAHAPRSLRGSLHATETGLIVVTLVLGVVAGVVAWTGPVVVPWWVSAGLFVLAFGYALLRANYAEVQKREDRATDLSRQLVSVHHEHYFEPYYQRLIGELVSEHPAHPMYGYTALARRLESGESTQAELSAAFEKWDEDVARHVGYIDESEVEFYRRPPDQALLEGTWRERLRVVLELRHARMEEIHIRQKSRLQHRIGERKKKEADSRKGRG